MSDTVLMWLLTALVSGVLGWAAAHAELATECERQGSFYVGKKDYECRVKP